MAKYELFLLPLSLGPTRHLADAHRGPSRRSTASSFLEAGAARVIVPVTPGFEDKVAWFLDPSNAAVNELERILTPPPTAPPSTTSDAFRDLWIELLAERKPDVARGSGTLSVESGNVKVQINLDSQWRVSAQRDLGR